MDYRIISVDDATPQYRVPKYPFEELNLYEGFVVEGFDPVITNRLRAAAGGFLARHKLQDTIRFTVRKYKPLGQDKVYTLVSKLPV